MSSKHTQRIQLDEFVDPFEVRLTVKRGANGAVEEVSFDLSGLPRVDAMLVGKQAAELPDITKKLCGICPVVHHLAGVRAVEALYGITDIPKAAQDVRRLLAYGSALESMSARYIAENRDFAISLKRSGKLLMAMAGSPTHFPDVAVAGGVRAPADLSRRAEAEEKLTELRLYAQQLIDAASDSTAVWTDKFAGAELAVVSEAGELDALGTFLAVQASANDKTIEGDEIREAIIVPVSEWPQLVTELRPGANAPGPVVRLGASSICYRVGPVARAIISGTAVPSPAVAQLHSVLETVTDAEALLSEIHAVQRDLSEEPNTKNSAAPDRLLVAADAEEKLRLANWHGTRTGVGVIDGPRGLLVHSYTATADGRVVSCQIMTPTAQNEPWLAQMLSAQFGTKIKQTEEAQLSGAQETPATNGFNEAEDAVRIADPCLPCSSAPRGLMNVKVSDHTSVR